MNSNFLQKKLGQKYNIKKNKKIWNNRNFVYIKNVRSKIQDNVNMIDTIIEHNSKDPLGYELQFSICL